VVDVLKFESSQLFFTLEEAVWEKQMAEAKGQGFIDVCESWSSEIS